jgi:FkbM family methyltransferase
MIQYLIPLKLRKAIRCFQYCFRLGLGRFCLSAFRSKISSRFIGTKYGGWWVPVCVLNSGGEAICCGCGTDVSFDLILSHVYKFNVQSFDPTPNSVAYVSDLIDGGGQLNFFPIGVFSRHATMKFYPPASSLDDSYSISNLQNTSNPLDFEVISLREHISASQRQPAILKMDIEGAEVSVIFNILKSQHRPDCILVEFDELAYPSKWRLARMRCICRMLRRYKYLLYRASGSNFAFVRQSLID